MILISANQEGLTDEENAIAHADMLDDLVEGLGIKGYIIETTGCYNGVEEKCFGVTLAINSLESIADTTALIFNIARKYNQEAIGGLLRKVARPTFGTLDLATGDSVVRYAVKVKQKPPKCYDWIHLDDHYWLVGIEVQEVFDGI